MLDNKMVETYKRRRLWNSKCTRCDKCGWVFMAHGIDYEWHEKNCEYIEGLKNRIIATRNNELSFIKKYFKKITGKN